MSEGKKSGSGGKWGYIWGHWVTLLLHILAILLFTRGFLLTRTELPFHSHCSDVSQSPCFSSNNNNSSCWTKPAVNRLVIIVLDAIRFDFVAPSTFFPGSPSSNLNTIIYKLRSNFIFINYTIYMYVLWQNQNHGWIDCKFWRMWHLHAHPPPGFSKPLPIPLPQVCSAWRSTIHFPSFYITSSHNYNFNWITMNLRLDDV